MVKVMGPVGTAVFFAGLLSFIVGVVLLFLPVGSRGPMDPRWGNFLGHVWFILVSGRLIVGFILLGFVLTVIGAMTSF
jgi:hypothetical protein